MRFAEGIVYIFFVANFVLLSSVAVQAKPIGMPKEPIVIEGVSPVRFDHVLHRSVDVPCGECHHDDKHNPRKDSEIYAIADSKELHCQNCHNKNFANPYLQSRKEIFHTNCRPCHAVGIKGKRGPRKCSGCHINKVVKD